MAQEVEDEISLLDILVVVAENWLLLVIAPLLVGSIIYGVLITQPQTFRSEATIALPPATIVDFVAAGQADGSLDPDIVFGGPGASGLTVAAGVEANSSELVLTTSDRSAGPALERLTESLTQAAQNGSLDQPRDELRNQMSQLGDVLALRDTIIARLEAVLAELAQDTPLDVDAYAASAIALNQMLTSRQMEQAERIWLGEVLAATTDEIIIEPPTPSTAEGRSPLLLAFLAALGTGFVLLVLIFIRHGLKGAARDDEARAKMARIRNGLLLRKGRPAA